MFRLNRKQMAGLAMAAVAVLLLLPTGEKAVPTAPDAVVVQQDGPGIQYAERVFYKGDGSREWGTVCRLPQGGYISVAHVTDNGIPVIGPKDRVTARNELSDWSFLGIDPAALDPEAFPYLLPGQEGEIVGFPARDRDGERVPFRVYTDDPDPATPFVWLELLDSPGQGVAAEGVIGGFSGSCVIVNGAPVAVVSANGFSVIEGTTNTWAKVVPVRAAIRQAQGLGLESAPQAMGFLASGPPVAMPQLETGRWGVPPKNGAPQ